MIDRWAKTRVWLLVLAVLALALTTLACGGGQKTESPPTGTPMLVCTPPLCEEGEVYYCPGDCPGGCGTQCVTPKPEPTETPEPTNTPGTTLEPFPSGGLGLSKAEWDQQHTEGDTAYGMVEYDDGKYSVTFADGNIQYLERVFADDQPTLDAARAEAQALIPEDSQFLETYSPEGMPEMAVDLYVSESLKERFDDSWFTGGEPGNFTVIYGVFDDRVPRIVIATGNNP